MDAALQKKALAYGALQRFWVTVDPEYAEKRWQEEFAFMNLPAELKTPGTWFRHQDDTGYIQYYPSGDAGEFHEQLPAGIDPASVVVIPKVSGFPSAYDRLKGLLLDNIAALGEGNVQRMIADMDELRSPGHAVRILRTIAGDSIDARKSGRQAVADYLAQKYQALSTVELRDSRATGFEAAALILLHSIHQQLMAADPPAPPILFSKMFDPTGVPSLQDMTARFLCDCYKGGMGAAVTQAIDNIRIGGDGTLEAARSSPQGELDPGVYLDFYYAGLQQAALRFLAARWGWQSVLTFGGLGDEDRQRAEKRLTSVEEKFVRCEWALLYALKDLDGSQYREKQQAIQEARAAGDQQRADHILKNVFDSWCYYPRAVKEVMSKGA